MNNRPTEADKRQILELFDSLTPDQQTEAIRKLIRLKSRNTSKHQGSPRPPVDPIC